MIIVGAEGPGLLQETIAGANAIVRIPIADDVDSLNVVVAAAIALERLRSRA
jgi:tRNA G18 (ribose-2'-O)-methylase SpoU